MPVITSEITQIDAFAATDGTGAFGAYVDSDNETCWVFQFRKGGFAHCRMADGSVIFQGNIFNDSTRLIDYHGQGTPFWAQDGGTYYSAVGGVLYKLVIGSSAPTDFGNGYLATQATLNLNSLVGSITIEGWYVGNGYLILADTGSGRMIAVSTANMQISGVYAVSGGIPIAAPFRDTSGGYNCVFAMPDKSIRLALWNPIRGASGGVLNVNVFPISASTLGTTAGVKYCTYNSILNQLLLGTAVSAYTGELIVLDLETRLRLRFKGDDSKSFYSGTDDCPSSAMQVGVWLPSGHIGLPGDSGDNTQVGGFANLVDPQTLQFIEWYNVTDELHDAGISVPTGVFPGRGSMAIPQPLANMRYNIPLDRVLVTYQPQGSPAYSVKVGIGGGGSPPVTGTPGLQTVRNYCQAYGIYVSGVMDTQKPASDWLTDLADIANCAVVWNGAQLNFIPRCEVSTAGNGALFVSATASGPVATFDDSIFVNKGGPPVTITRTRPADAFNVYPIEHINRGNQYNHEVTTVRDQGDIYKRGAIKATTRQLLWIHDKQTATKVGWPLLRRSTLVTRLAIAFTLPITYSWLDGYDLVALVDKLLGLQGFPCRLTDISENENYELQCTAEPFYYGAHAPTAQVPSALPVNGWTANQQADPGSVNPPIIFEPVQHLNQFQNSGSIMIIVCGSSPNYGGCNVHLSTNGGQTYNPKGTLQGNPSQGLTFTADFPITPDPDTTQHLFVDLTESSGTLDSFDSDQRDLFQSVCYVDGGGIEPGGTLPIPYELVAYADANLITGNQYDIPPTIRRGVYNTPIADHPIGSKFAFVSTNELVQFALDPSLIGKQLFFKFTAFNIFLQNEQDISDPAVIAYPYTPIGIGSVITFPQPVFIDKWLAIYPDQFDLHHQPDCLYDVAPVLSPIVAPPVPMPLMEFIG